MASAAYLVLLNRVLAAIYSVAGVQGPVGRLRGDRGHQTASAGRQQTIIWYLVCRHKALPGRQCCLVLNCKTGNNQVTALSYGHATCLHSQLQAASTLPPASACDAFHDLPILAALMRSRCVIKEIQHWWLTLRKMNGSLAAFCWVVLSDAPPGEGLGDPEAELWSKDLLLVRAPRHESMFHFAMDPACKEEQDSGRSFCHAWGPGQASVSAGSSTASQPSWQRTQPVSGHGNFHILTAVLGSCKQGSSIINTRSAPGGRGAVQGCRPPHANCTVQHCRPISLP